MRQISLIDSLTNPIHYFVFCRIDTIHVGSLNPLFSFVQMKKFHVDDPSDLCSIRISGQELREVGVDWNRARLDWSC